MYKINLKQKSDICDKCKGRYCRKEITDANVKMIADEFWRMPRLIKIAYVRNLVQVKEHESKVYKSSGHRKNGTCLYTLNVDNEIVRVCKEKFLEVHSLKDKTVYYWVKDLTEEKYALDFQHALEIDPNFALDCASTSNAKEDGDFEEMIGGQKIEKLRPRNPIAWKCNQRRLKRMKGEAYLKTQGDEVAKKREMGPPCGSKVCYKAKSRFCSTFNEEERQKMFNEFWIMDWEQKKNYVCSLVELTTVKRARVVGSKRGGTFKYHLFNPRIQGKKLPVCQITFMRTFAIGNRMVRNWVKKKMYEENELESFDVEYKGERNLAIAEPENVDLKMENINDDEDEEMKNVIDIEVPVVLPELQNEYQTKSESNDFSGMTSGEYTDKDNKIRETGPRCESSYCRSAKSRHCKFFTDDERRLIFSNFCAMSWEHKREMVCNLVKQQFTTRDVATNDLRPKATYIYHLTRENHPVQVCRTFFLSTLRIREKTVRNWLKKVDWVDATKIKIRQKLNSCNCILRTSRQCQKLNEKIHEAISGQFNSLSETEKLIYIKKYVRMTKRSMDAKNPGRRSQCFIEYDGKKLQICKAMFAYMHKLSNATLDENYLKEEIYNSIPYEPEVPTRKTYKKRKLTLPKSKEPEFYDCGSDTSTDEEEYEENIGRDYEAWSSGEEESNGENETRICECSTEKTDCLRITPKELADLGKRYWNLSWVKQKKKLLILVEYSKIDINFSQNYVYYLTNALGNHLRVCRELFFETLMIDEDDLMRAIDSKDGDKFIMGPNCKSYTCLKSVDRFCNIFENEHQQEIYNHFQKLNLTEKDSFFREFVKQTSEETIFYLRYHNKILKVCRETFVNTIGVNDDYLQEFNI